MHFIWKVNNLIFRKIPPNKSERARLWQNFFLKKSPKLCELKSNLKFMSWCKFFRIIELYASDTHYCFTLTLLAADLLKLWECNWRKFMKNIINWLIFRITNSRHRLKSLKLMTFHSVMRATTKYDWIINFRQNKISWLISYGKPTKSNRYTHLQCFHWVKVSFRINLRCNSCD